jgi:hypothetical protein
MVLNVAFQVTLVFEREYLVNKRLLNSFDFLPYRIFERITLLLITDRLIA